MTQTITELEFLIPEYAKQLKLITEDKFSAKPNPEKWSKKEILGHLIDSAQTNTRRFIVVQYEENSKIVYNQEKWVVATDYQHYPTDDLIDFWNLINKHICRVLKNIPPGLEKRICITESEHSLEWLAEDYLKHLRHHMHVILDLEPVAYP